MSRLWRPLIEVIDEQLVLLIFDPLVQLKELRIAVRLIITQMLVLLLDAALLHNQAFTQVGVLKCSQVSHLLCHHFVIFHRKELALGELLLEFTLIRL